MSGKITRVSIADLENLPDGTDWARIDAMTDEEAEANALADPDNFPPERAIPSARSRVIRIRLGLTQEEFSARYHIPLGTLRDWEQHRAEPDQATRAYLKVIAKEPELVARALSEQPPAAAAE
jgi:putative transcriptional regulator